MGCLALILNFILPGLGSLLFTNKRVQGFIQLFLAVVNYILVFVTVGFWLIIGIFIHLGVFIWSLVTTMSFTNEQTVKKAIKQERDRQG